MSLTTTVPRSPFTGTGLLNTYAYTFKVFAEADLRVTVRDTTNVDLGTLILGVDYTVTGVLNDSGGTIVFVNAGQSWLTTTGFLKAGYRLVIRRVREKKQDNSVKNQTTFYGATHEDAWDKLAMMAQDLQDASDRSIKFPETETPGTAVAILPSTTDRASKFLAFDASGNVIASSGGISSSIPVSAFVQTLLDDANAAAFLATLGASSIFAALSVSAYIQTLLPAVDAATARTTLGFGGTGGTIESTDLDSETTTSPLEIFNLRLNVTVAANALTIAVKTRANADPSAASPVLIGIRPANATTGGYSRCLLTTAHSLVISSGSTLGHTSAVEGLIYVYAIDNGANAFTIAASSNLFDDGSVLSTTAEGGAGAADSNALIYATSVTINAGSRLIGRIRITEATAGTWVTAPTEVTVGSFERIPTSRVDGNTPNGHGSTNTRVRRFTNAATVGADITYADSVTLGMSLTINRTGLYSLSYTDLRAAGACSYGWSLNSAALTTSINTIAPAERLSSVDAATGLFAHTGLTIYLRAGDVIRTHTDGTPDTVSATGQFRVARVA